MIDVKLSTKGRYGLRAMIDLALHCQDGQTVALSEIAERQNLSLSYLEQLIASLRKAGIVNSIRGAQGGYVLARPVEEISVGDILRTLEGSLNIVNCGQLQEENRCNDSDFCVTKYVWQRISNSINDTVNSMALSELVEVAAQIEEKRSSITDGKITYC